MFFKILDWIYHGKSEKNKLPIFSIDIQPFQNFIISCSKDCLLKIWQFPKRATNSINIQYKVDIMSDFSTLPKSYVPIYTIETNSRSTNIIRWSYDGLKFAFSGDDGILVIYEKNVYKKKIEEWSIYYQFKNHNGDISDLSWCPNSIHIATASLDNSVQIWSVRKKIPVVILHGHHAWVKSVTWDPTGYLIATKSENKKILIWNTLTFKPRKIIYKQMIQKKFINESQNFSSDQIQWTPCGRFLLANRCKELQNRFEVYDRFKNFHKSFSLIFKKKKIALITCSSRLDIEKYKKKKTGSVIAICTTNGEMVIWHTSYAKNLIFIKNLTKSKITAGNWSSCGYILVLTFTDGSVMIIKFNSEELGKTVNRIRHLEIIKMICSKFLKKKKRIENNNCSFYSKLKKMYYTIDMKDHEFLLLKKISDNFYISKIKRIFKILIDTADIRTIKPGLNVSKILLDMEKYIHFLQKRSAGIKIIVSEKRFSDEKILYKNLNKNSCYETRDSCKILDIKEFNDYCFMILLKKNSFFMTKTRKKDSSIENMIRFKSRMYFTMFKDNHIVIYSTRDNVYFINKDNFSFTVFVKKFSIDSQNRLVDTNFKKKILTVCSGVIFFLIKI